MDHNNDGYVDYNDFTKTVVVENDLVQKLRDVIQLNNLETDDVLLRMNLNRNTLRVDKMTLL